MKKYSLKKITALILVSGFVSGIAMADGFYAGFQSGVEFSKIKRDDPIMAELDIGLEKTSNMNSFDAGLYFGYRQEFNDKVIGVETDVSFLETTRTLEGSYSKHYTPLILIRLGYTIKDKVSQTGNLCFVGGYKLNENVEVYGRLGISTTKITRSFSVDLTNMTSTFSGGVTPTVDVQDLVSTSISKRLIGGVVGVGANLNLACLNEAFQNWNLRADYRYIRYKPKKMDSLEKDGLKHLLERHVVLVGLDYRF